MARRVMLLLDVRLIVFVVVRVVFVAVRVLVAVRVILGSALEFHERAR